MPTLRIDHRDVEVPPGATILDAARKLAIDVPTLCYLEGCRPSTSCLVCLVKVRGQSRFLPSCGVLAADGMEVESETEEVHQARRVALELLLSDHLGDCQAPCQLTCPAEMNIPQMLRQIAAGQLREAIVTVKRDIALPAVLGRICPAPCEKACRRRPADGAVAICALKRLAADADLESAEPYLPPCQPATGKRVAILGGGPTGLSAAYCLRQQGHACTIFDENERPGGRLRRETTDEQLPRNVLDREIEQILRLGVETRLAARAGTEPSLAQLVEQFDAVLVACGTTARQQAEAWGLKVSPRGIEVNRQTYETGVRGVFAAGNAIRGKGLVVRSVGDGKEVAFSIDQHLSGLPVAGPPRQFTTKIGVLEPDELEQYLRHVSPLPLGEGQGEGGSHLPLGEGQGIAASPANPPSPQPSPRGRGSAAGLSPQVAVAEAARCMHCDCRGAQTCKLRKYAAQYGADPRRYHAPRRRFQQDTQHALVIYEPGKCIDCGLCVQIAREGGEPLGLTFIGRGFNVRVGVPLGASVAEGLKKVAAECAAACPTAALAMKDRDPSGY